MRSTYAYMIASDAVEAERRRIAGDLARVDFTRVLALCERPLGELGERDVRLRILAASAEHNVIHALLADTVDIVRAHGGRMFPGNSAVAEVIEVGSQVEHFLPGQLVQTTCAAWPDQYGYPQRIWGYDQPDAYGCYCEETIVSAAQILPLPLDCGLSLWQMAALPLRAPTAYHLWRRALGIFRVKVSAEQRARLNVLSFGGGVGELFLMLAQATGHQAYFCSANPERRAALARRGVHPIDRRSFQDFGDAADLRRFRAECKDLTASEGMHIVCDMQRGPVFEAGLSAAARQGVNVSAGWQLSKRVSYDSAALSTRQVTLDHIHYDTVAGCRAATELYGTVFKPNIHKELYSFEELPRCFQEMQRNLHTGIPVVRVARDLPASAQAIA